MLSVQVTISGDKETFAKLNKLGDKLTDFTDAMKTLGTELVAYYGSNNDTPGQVFSSEGGVFGVRWEALSPVYRKWKGKHYPGKGVLVATGTLMKGFRATSDSSSVTIDNPVPYFGYLHSGTKRMAARPMLAVNSDVKGIIQNVIHDDIEQKLESI